jgi:arginine-tRNA-protein transferase
MDYKTKFKPLERLGRDGWRRMDEPEDGVATGPVELPLRRSRRRITIDA